MESLIKELFRKKKKSRGRQKVRIPRKEENLFVVSVYKKSPKNRKSKHKEKKGTRSFSTLMPFFHSTPIVRCANLNNFKLNASMTGTYFII